MARLWRMSQTAASRFKPSEPADAGINDRLQLE